MQIGPGKGFQRLSFRTPLNRALLMISFTSSIDITPVNTLTLVQKWTYEIGPSNSLFILSVKPSHLTFHKLTCYCVLAYSYQLTNREALTLLCSVIKHAGSGQSTKEVQGEANQNPCQNGSNNLIGCTGQKLSKVSNHQSSQSAIVYKLKQFGAVTDVTFHSTHGKGYQSKL